MVESKFVTWESPAARYLILDSMFKGTYKIRFFFLKTYYWFRSLVMYRRKFQMSEFCLVVQFHWGASATNGATPSSLSMLTQA